MPLSNVTTQSRSTPPVRGAIVGSWALLLGFGILMLGDGLQATLLSVRAALEAFPTTITGAVMSVYFVGFLVGSLYAPRIVERVGHIRVFAALASLASASILLHAVLVNPFTWAALRLFSGFCFAGLYVVAESWLNDRATNQTRGQLLSVYMVVSYVGVALGQLLMNAADPLGFGLFILTSVLISFALVPLLLSATPAPSVESHSPINVVELFRISPLGVVGAMSEGMATAAFFAMGPVYATLIGLGIKEVSLLMTAAVIGCVLLQFPIGQLSDRFDRRRVIFVTTMAAGAAAIAVASQSADSWHLYALIGVFGGLSLPLYSLCIAHANDFLEPEQMVGASGGLVLASGIGAVIGPLLVSVVMSQVGPEGLFYSLGAIHVLLGVFALYRMFKRPAKPLSEQGPHMPTAAHASQIAVELELNESTARQRRDAEE